jgi:hypothetical protein
MNNNAELAKKLRNWQLHLDTIPDIIEEAAAALEAPPAGIDWRLIADMPDALKDGREVLGFSDDWGATTMMYEKGGIPPFWSVDVWDFLPANSGLHQYEILPTHYAEITPPAAASGEPELESAKVWDGSNQADGRRWNISRDSLRRDMPKNGEGKVVQWPSCPRPHY